MRLFEFAYNKGGWLNIKTKDFVSTNGMYHTLAIFHNMEKFGLTPEKMKSIPAFAKWFKLDWAEKLGHDDTEELQTWWWDLGVEDVPTLDNKSFDENTTSYKSTGYLLDGDMEIIKWMNSAGWLRVARHREGGTMETSIQGNTLRQVVQAARLMNKDEPIERLYFDVNDLKSGMELEGDQLTHFLKYGNLNFNIRDRF